MDTHGVPIFVEVVAWNGDNAECELDAALTTARQLWKDAGTSPGKPSIHFYIDGVCIRTVNDYRELEER